MNDERHIEVWNQAAWQDWGGRVPAKGDIALAAVLRLEGEAMNNGIAHAVVDSLSAEELVAACTGYRYFGLDQAAQFVETLITRVGQIAGEEELWFQKEFEALGPSRLSDAFDRQRVEQPRDFSLQT